MSALSDIFYTVQQELFQERKKEANEFFHEELKELDKRNIPYTIRCGYYDYDGFNLDRILNGDDADSYMIDDGFDFVLVLKNYYDKLDFSAVCQIQVRIDIDEVENKVLSELGYDILYMEYNGYELFDGTF